MSVQSSIQYLGDLKCAAKHGPSGQVIETDAPIDNGGLGERFSPTDLVGAALATCIMTILGLVAKRRGLDVEGMRADVEKDMVADPVRRIGRLAVRVALPASISPEDREVLERAAGKCPVKQSLHPEVQLDIQYIYE